MVRPAAEDPGLARAAVTLLAGELDVGPDAPHDLEDASARGDAERHPGSAQFDLELGVRLGIDRVESRSVEPFQVQPVIDRGGRARLRDGIEESRRATAVHLSRFPRRAL